MGLKKNYLKSKPVCRVTFKLSKKEIADAKSVKILGDFNNWDENSTYMKKLKNGAFSATIDLEPNREYQFRYLIDDLIWENDWDADKYVPSEYGDSDNSVVIT